MPVSEPLNKKDILIFLKSLIADNRKRSIAHYEEIRNSVLTESKSSAGDKHETARAMAQIELDKAANIVQQQEKLMAALNRLENINQEPKHIALGSLIKCSGFFIYISVGIGKISYQNHTIYTTGFNSPLAQQIKGKKLNESFDFNGKSYSILELT